MFNNNKITYLVNKSDLVRANCSMEPSNRLHRAIHTFRQSARASSLFPNWLKHSDPESDRIRPLWWISFRWFCYRFLSFSTPQNQAQEYFLQCLILENKLLQLTASQEQWEKNFIHHERQEQLDYFEKLLHLYLRQTNDQKLKERRQHTFPEIILVMAQTFEESETHALFQEAALKLINSYDLLRLFLQKQMKGWKIHKIELEENDPMITLLLRFKDAWDSFRESRSVQIKQPSENPIIEEIISRLDPPEEASPTQNS